MIFARNFLAIKISNSSSNGNIKPVYSTLTCGTANCKLFDERRSSSLLSEADFLLVARCSLLFARCSLLLPVARYFLLVARQKILKDIFLSKRKQKVLHINWYKKFNL